jgi:glycosidase
MPGVPGVYFHSLVGSRNYHDGVKHTGVNRTINREKYNIDWLENELSTQGTLAKTMFDSYKRLISIRTSEVAFNPFGTFRFLDLDSRLLIVDQHCCQDKEHVLAIHNFSDETVSLRLPDEYRAELYDLLTSYRVDESREVTLQPYQMMWLKGHI